MDHSLLSTAIILLDRPVVGLDGHGANERLPADVRLRATVVGLGPVACAIDVDVVRALSARERPTWADLQVVWQDLATAIQDKIRTGALDATGQPHGWRGVRIGSSDVPRAPRPDAADDRQPRERLF